MKPSLAHPLRRISAILSAVVLLAAAASAGAATLTVNSTADTAGDDGECTLREAITAANSNAASGMLPGECAAGDPGADTIEFALGTGTPTINLLSQLPSSGEPVAIDGHTGGATRVELNGALAGAASGITVFGGDSVLRSLVVNRFNGTGIALLSDGNRVEDCFVGTDSTGTADLGNTLDGILILSGSNNTVGGAAAGTANVVSGNGSRGIEISSAGTGNVVRGNRIGTDASGTVALGNAGIGVLVFTADNTIGGTAPGEGNVISGNGTAGVRIEGAAATSNLVQGNSIGVDASGTAAIGNGQDGVLIVFSAANNVIGGTAAGAGNVISGNVWRGVSISMSATANSIEGNRIGTNAAGTAAIGNGFDGVGLFADGNTVGGSDAGAGNLISGNGVPSGSGVYVDVGVSGSTVQGNLIGTNAAGTAAIANSFNGVQIRGANSLIGGTAEGARNVVSGNTTTGVFFTASASGNLVQGNWIGTAGDGTSALGNGRDGVTLGSTTTGPASSNTIGGPSAAAGNRIAFNGRDGVRVTGGTANAILSNRIFSNTNLGIDLGGNGVTANDLGSPPDGDTGANNLQNFPVVTSASSNGSTTHVAGSLDSTPSTAFTVQVFSSPTCDGTNGEGRTFLGQVVVPTDASGHASIAATLPVGMNVGDMVTTTATDPAGNTSEFSACSTATQAEICFNCIDDDGDGLVDRDDPDCPARADGAQQGLGDPVRGKRIDTCGKAIQTAGVAYAKKRLGRIQTCLNLVSACVQQKPGDARCLTKASTSCAKGLDQIPGDEAKLTAAINKACGPAKVTADELREAEGLGFSFEAEACADVGGPEPLTVGEIATCVARRHACRGDQALALESPRAAELLALAGRSPASELPCLGTAADGGGGGITDRARAKAAIGCAKALEKAGTSFVAAKMKNVDTCLRALTKCMQTGGPATCTTKARASCAKAIGNLSAPKRGVEAKLVAAIGKACSKPELSLSDVLDDRGVGFGAHAATCAALGVPSLTSVADISECIERQHECRAEQLLEAETPRLHELITYGGTPLP